MVRLFSPIICHFCLLSALIGLTPDVSAAAALPDGQAFQTLVAADLAAGRITAAEALLLRFQYGFAPDQLPERYQVTAFSPLRCATGLIAEYYRERPRLTTDTITRIDGWLQPGADKSQYVSPSGHFQLAYSVVGMDAVPVLDISPANGIPDFVENVARYFDRSWAVEVDSLGFVAPPGAVYVINFESMQYYGYTTVVDEVVGETRIVMHNNYAGFPANDDPEGDVAGAARVTAAHEFKHASQYATSRWSEGGWNELDATWMEDVVYDQVNDYYNYLNGESPMRQPEIPLDGGANTTGSYEDCVWQTFLTETWGISLVQDFWDRRALFPGEEVMDTYRVVLNTRETSPAEAWAAFTAWNYGVGERAVAGLGYEEGAFYPEGPVIDTVVMYPFAAVGSVEHLAAQFVRLDGFSETDTRLLRVLFDGQDGAGPLTPAVHVRRRDGSGVIETIVLDGDNDVDHLLSVPLREIQAAAIVVGNAAFSGPAGTWELNLSLVAIPAVPAATVDRTEVPVVLMADTQDQVPVRLTNTGEEGSLLEFTAQLWTMSPDSGLMPLSFLPADDKSVSGSSFTCTSGSYLAGQPLDLDFSVFNGSTDEEWLTALSLDFPAGVAVLASSDFSGGSLGDLVSDDSVGDGALVSWCGTYGSQNYGVVRGGESAAGTVQVMVQTGFSGDLDIGWTLDGDSFGTTPHQLAGTISLAEDSPTLTLNSPNGGEIYAVGDTFAVTWSTGSVVSPVDLELSRDAGTTWTTEAAGVANNGNYRLALSGPPANSCLLRVTATDGTGTDTGDGLFQLYAAPDWVTVAPTDGLLAAAEFQDLVLTLNSKDLTAGDHAAWLVVLHNAPTARVVVPVTLTVESGLSALRETRVFAVRGACPNPFNPRTSIAFELPAAALTTVDVLDVRGRRMRRLFQGVLTAGCHEQVWDGRNAAGHGVGAGVYLVRISAGSHTGTVKVLLAK